MRIAAGVCYDGSRFDGWQSQPSGNTVQDHLERSLARIAGSSVRVTAAGRTDAGVHATGQVFHFDVEVARPEAAWVRGTNAFLPDAIAVQWAVPVDEKFHARFSAVARTYRYVLFAHPVRPSVLAPYVGWFHHPLDAAAMGEGARHLVGRHDFSAFRAAECQAKSPVRNLHSATIETRGPYIVIELRADAFLHHMVRNIVGALVYVGCARQPPEWIAQLRDGRNRGAGAPTFSPNGLYLARVEYGPEWTFPAFAPMMPILPDAASA